MVLPEPRPGLVISYAYLWATEDRAGREEGAKDRPCAIVLTYSQQGGSLVAIVAPVTHSPPLNMDEAVEIPLETKMRLGLDAGRSWVIVSEVNRFVWPGPDLRPVSRDGSGRFAYGFLPPGLFKRITGKLARIARKGRLGMVDRTT